MSCLLSCFNCLSIIGLRNYLLRKLAFFPPEDGYSLVQDGVYELQDGITIPKYKFEGLLLQADDYEIEFDRFVQVNIFQIKSKTGAQIPIYYCKYLKPQRKQQVILYSHGNSTDLLRMRECMIELCYELQCDIVAYEYTGYGDFSRKPSDFDICNDIQSVYHFILSSFDFKWYDIIAYGQSLGSGPSTFLASNYYTPILGVILHSPISSGTRVIEQNVEKTMKRDFFPNVDMIKYAKSPVFIIHGVQDQEVGMVNGQIIFNNCKCPYTPWWVPNAGHNDIAYLYRQDYFLKLNQFVDFIQELKCKFEPNEMLSQFQAQDWNPDFSHIYNSKKYRLQAYNDKKEKQRKKKEKSTEDTYAELNVFKKSSDSMGNECKL